MGQNLAEMYDSIWFSSEYLDSVSKNGILISTFSAVSPGEVGNLVK